MSIEIIIICEILMKGDELSNRKRTPTMIRATLEERELTL